jgi:hypothetical protein
MLPLSRPIHGGPEEYKTIRSDRPKRRPASPRCDEACKSPTQSSENEPNEAGHGSGEEPNSRDKIPHPEDDP